MNNQASMSLWGQFIFKQIHGLVSSLSIVQWIVPQLYIFMQTCHQNTKKKSQFGRVILEGIGEMEWEKGKTLDFIAFCTT